MHSYDNAAGAIPLESCRRDACTLQALHHFSSVGRSAPERAWELFNRECTYWLTAVFGASGGNNEDAPHASQREHGVARPVPGGHEVSGVWRRGAQSMSAGDWTVVRAHVSRADEPSEPFLYAVHSKQWKRPLDESAGADQQRQVLDNAFIAAGQISHVPVTGQLKRWPADAVLVGSTSLSLGIAAGALERMKAPGGFGSAEGRAPAALALQRQQCADLELATMHASNMLGTMVDAYERAATASERDSSLWRLAEEMRSAASVAQLVTTSSYEFFLDSADATERQAMTRFISNVTPALQNGRLAGEFLKIMAQQV